MKLVQCIFGVCLFTASCDVILNFNLGGSLRLAQLLMILICLAGMARIIQDGRVLWPRGGTALMIWVFWQMACLPLSGTISVGLLFFSLLVFTVAGMFALVQLYGRSERLESLMKLYLASFLAVGGYGLLQAFGPLFLHVPLPYTEQWLIHGRLARVNGFSYEPSFFATYVFVGWIMLVDLRASKAVIAQGRWMKWATYGLSLALILSTSKTAWLGMALEGLARLSPVIWRASRRMLPGISVGVLRIKIPRPRYVLYPLLGLALAVPVIASLPGVFLTADLFLSGTGIAGTPAHSVTYRDSAFRDTWQAFTDSPFIGTSLGGVPVKIASQHGVEAPDMAEARQHWGFPVILDVLVASGLIGFIPFLVFLYQNTFGAFRMAQQHFPREGAKWLRAAARAMIFEWVLLLVDQNLLRTYLWFHFAMVAILSYHLEFGPEVRGAEEQAIFVRQQEATAL